MSATLKYLALASLFALCCVAAPVTAGEPVCPPKYVAVVKYVKVVCPVETQVPYTCTVTKYDHCGKPYYVTITKYKTVIEYVEKIVKKIEYVPAPDYAY